MSRNNKPNYLTRTSKHIERKIFIEAFQRLAKANYDISNYHYVGFGCYYYVDFILFHRLLSIKKMTCLEKQVALEERMEFNKPFKFIDFQLDDFSNYISTLREDEKYFIWADYEDRLNEDKLIDIQSIVNTLIEGSIFIITVNVDMKIEISCLDERDIEKIEAKQTKLVLEQSIEELGCFVGDIELEDVMPTKLPELYAKAIINTIKIELLASRPNVKFHQLFNYIYQDGVRMLSIGGIIDDVNKARDIKNAVKDIKYINYNIQPVSITVPSLTLREKLYLDTKIQKNSKISSNPFKLKDREIKNYIKYSKHYPTFYEVFTS